MEFKSESIGKVEIINDKDSSKYLGIRLQGASHLVSMPSNELTNIIALALIDKGIKPSSNLIKKTTEELEAFSFRVQDIEEVHTRYAIKKDCLYIRLGDGDMLLKISEKGIKRLKNKNIRFKYSKHINKLPYQDEAEGNLELFWKYASVSSEEDKLLLLVYLINACLPDTNYPILLITGGPGSGKSFLTYMIEALIDPTNFGLSASLESPEDIVLAAIHNHLLRFDNNGVFNAKIQNLLCQVSTGAKLSLRKLFTNKGVMITELSRPIIINSLRSPFSQHDVIDRVLHLRLRQLTPKDYAKTGGEKKWKAQYEADLPSILKGFYQILQRVIMIRDTVKLPSELPRMADYAILGIAVEQALKFKKGTFLKAYENNLSHGLSQIIEDSELAHALISLAGNLKEAKTYKRNDLIQLLKNYSGSPQALPKTAKELGAELEKIRKSLFKLKGIRIAFLNRSGAGYRVKITPPSKGS